MNSIDELAKLVEETAKTRSRNQKIEQLSQAIEKVPDHERSLLVSFLCGDLGVGKIGVGPAAVNGLRKALPSPRPESQDALTFSQVRDRLQDLRDTSGAGSKARKTEQLLSLLAATTQTGQRFLLKLLAGELRQGALAGVVEKAVIKATESDEKLFRRAVTLTGSLPKAAVLAVELGDSGLAQVEIEVFRALSPMLASPAESPADALERWPAPFCELKLDGARIQVHREHDQVKVYTRALREVTKSVPEVVSFAQSLKRQRFILDGEVIALHLDGRPKPFQETMKRFGRSGASSQMQREIPLTPFFFDVLLDGQDDLLETPFTQRRERLRSLVGQAIMEGSQFKDEESIQNYLDEAMSRGFEGVMVKNTEGLYEAGRRGYEWLKLKPFHTLDLVVLACEWGSGRRKGLLSNLHLGARDKDGSFVMLGKTFKGLTDELLAWQTEKLLALETHREDYVVYVKPELVVEIAFNDLQESQTYPGGLALRFARVKGYRPDKSPSEADTLETVKKIFQASL